MGWRFLVVAEFGSILRRHLDDTVPGREPGTSKLDLAVVYLLHCSNPEQTTRSYCMYSS